MSCCCLWVNQKCLLTVPQRLCKPVKRPPLSLSKLCAGWASRWSNCPWWHQPPPQCAPGDALVHLVCEVPSSLREVRIRQYSPSHRKQIHSNRIFLLKDISTAKLIWRVVCSVELPALLILHKDKTKYCRIFFVLTF